MGHGKLSAEQRDYLLESLTSLFPKSKLVKALELIRGSGVTDAQTEDGQIWTLAVSERGKRHRVDLNIDFFTVSGCSCGVSSLCIHLATAAAWLLEQSGYSAERLVAGDSPDAAGTPQERQPRSGEWSGIAAGGWLSMLRSRYGTGGGKAGSHSFEQLVLKSTKETAAAFAGLPEAGRQLALLQLQLVLLERAERLMLAGVGESTLYQSLYNTNYRDTVVSILRKLVQTVASIDVQEVWKQYADELESVRELLRSRWLDSQQQAINWGFVYRLCWWGLLNRPEWVVQEQQAVSAWLADQPPGAKRNPGILALVHFRFLDGSDDEELFRSLESLSGEPDYGMMLPYLHELRDKRDWSRLRHWLLWISSRIRLEDREELYGYFSFWLALRTGESAYVYVPEEELAAMESYLPGSYYLYSELLIERGLYREWVELQLMLRLTPTEVQPGELKAVERTEPTLLLPLYHYAALLCVRQRTRESYQLAVRYMKRLRDMYVQAGKAADWGAFMEAFVERHARLRALLEELKKGKLIS